MQVKSFGKVLFNILFRPWLWMALGLHGWVLSLPIPPAPKPSQPMQVIEIPLTQLVPPKAPVSVVKQPVPSPVARSPVPAPPVSQPRPALPNPVLSSPVLSSPVLSSPVKPPTVQASPPEPVPLTPSPEPLSTPLLAPSPQPWSSFPQVAGSRAGCHDSENCWQTADTQWRSIATNLRQTLQMQSYSLEELPLEEDTGRRIYRVSKPNEAPYYLNLVSTREGTVYFLTEQPMTAEALNQVSGS